LTKALPIVALLLTAVLSPALRTNTVHDVDFKNFEYPWDEPSGDMTAWRWLHISAATAVRLADGAAQLDDSDKGVGPPPSLRLTSVTYGILGSHGNEAAAIELNYNTGGTANWDYLYVYEFRSGSPNLLGRLQSGSRAYGGWFMWRFEVVLWCSTSRTQANAREIAARQDISASLTS
jgi:hypothetical protein